jgi:hypothetical protein
MIFTAEQLTLKVTYSCVDCRNTRCGSSRSTEAQKQQQQQQQELHTSVKHVLAANNKL